VTSTGPERAQLWFETHPERLEWELEQFAVRELPATQQQGLRDGRYHDRLVVETELTFKGERVPIEVVFPFEYPDEPPTIYGPAGLLDRHQSPLGGNFCVPTDADHDWWPGSDAAHLVAEDLRWLLEDTERGADAIRAGEADMPEPVTGHLNFDRGAVVVVPDPFFNAELPASEGEMVLLRDRARFFLTEASGLGTADPQLVRRFIPRGQRESTGHWVALARTPHAAAFRAQGFRHLIEDAPGLHQRLTDLLKQKPQDVYVERWLGITFMEEGPLRGQHRRNWVFGHVRLYRGGQFLIPSGALWLRAEALTLEERQQRIPELVGLEHARVLLVGAGSLGSPVAFELAKAGVGHLDVIDGDFFDVNNSVRHGLSADCAGLFKAEAVSDQARAFNPFIAVQPHVFKVGGGRDEATKLVALVAAATVVVDTTGSNTVARVLQRRCSELGRPLVIAGLTAGSHGGVIRIAHGDGPCFDCFLLRQQDGDIPEAQVAPRTSLVTPVGCSHPAFSGAGFDATQLAAVIARVVVQTSGASSYPAAGFNWAVVNFRAAPRWRSGTAERHPDCGRHE
jgi:molybdopterin/thiamine biosynthesis adenylyltransferase